MTMGSADVKTVNDCLDVLEDCFQSLMWKELPQEEKTRLVARLSHIMDKSNMPLSSETPQPYSPLSAISFLVVADLVSRFDTLSRKIIESNPTSELITYLQPLYNSIGLVMNEQRQVSDLVSEVRNVLEEVGRELYSRTEAGEDSSS
jgi:hypothetical protein